MNADMRLESGTCNVCSAACSSCMHPNRALMGSKAEEFSDENCRLGEVNQYCDESDRSSLGSRACERLKHGVSETSHKPSVSSTHDSLSENAENSQALSEKYQDSKCLESLDDSTSCISRTSNANLASSCHQINTDRINISCSSTSVSHLVAEGSGNGPTVDISSLSECCMENVDSSLTKERVPIIVPGEKSLADKENLNNGTAKVSIEICPKSEEDTENNVDVAEDDDHKYSAHDGLHEKVEELIKSSGRAEPQSEDESDESDVVEHDVKVCDICGDAGREDLLAICSRCSDGAEHTYCMREMLEKVPEGDWLCEECKCAEETANRKLDIEEKKNHKVSSTSQISGKRPSQSMEIATAAKRQALESSTGSPKASSPKRIVPLSRESSFKSMDKEKMKSGQQKIPMHNHLGGDDTELARSLSAGPRSQNARSTLLKSNSFNNNSKPRVKLVDEVVPQKQKGVVEHISKNMETPAGMISKSMSFKLSNLGRSNAVESKVKMISSKPGTTQDLKASRHAKDSASFDRKFLSKIDRPVICSTMVSSVVSTSKGDPKLTPHGETAKPSTVNNNREFKVNQDGKLYSLSKSMNNTSSKSPEPQVSSDRTSTSVDETQQDKLPRSQDTANQVDKAKDSSIDHVMSGVTNASKSSFCRKCKDFGHATECCTVSGTQEFGAESSVIATSSSKEEMHEGNRLKAAIQAALLRRPEIHKRKEAPDQTNEFPTSSTGLKREVTSQKQVLVSSTLKNSISAEESNMKQEIIVNSTVETSKCPSANDLKQVKFCRTDFCSQLRKSDSVGPTSGKPVVRDLPNNAMEISSILSKMSVIPEYEYIWQGVFKVHRNGMPPDLYTGIQAHLSACASPKVHEVVKKFLPEVSLNEVSRLSIWPSQFHQGGAKEDNIALYFFAKDIESYERYYKGLLDHMIRNDLALRGTSDGVELLIFASNQLPEDSQRWNMLFFLWGIFRGRRINHLDSTKKICIPSLNVMPNEKDFPTAVMTLSETRCSPKRMDEEFIDQDHNMVSRNFDGKETIFDQTHLGLLVNLERQDARINTKSTSGIPTIRTQLCQQMNSTGSSLRDSVPEHRQYIESKPPEAMETSVSSRIVETKTNHDISVKQENSLSSGIPSVGYQEIDTASNINRDKILDRTNNDENQQRPKRKQMEDDLDINVEATFLGDLTVKAVNCQLPNDKKVKHIDLSDTAVEASAVSCQKMPWNEVNGKFENGESYSKKLQTGFGGIHGCYDSGARESFNGSFASLVNDLGSCSSGENKRCKKPCDEKIIHEDLGAMERTFFPVDTRKKKDSGMVLNEPRAYVDQFQVGIPNLELGLGGETKPSHKGMLPFFVGAVDKKNSQEKTPDILTDEREDENVAASLSLSLSFPSSNKEHVKPVTKAEDGHNVNSPYLLFGRFTDK
ncbi:uncharacterized protein LOC114376286 isoform X2 [Glycine soja]|uniref:PHD-type domain-containing protein n=1 Tax=Glycine soja TaxID=3848 RepID=A0A445HZW0_GLYSO|nr:uncharacterized protein LOC100784908 isoform X2 [Glycine max]XP_028190134.1 uncharacterized protein LOC114376286 isoform X2 [Glycine soja]XP_040862628.1 uncharacterized protein LOC100784908 isoform X2 [Glycine max]RZB79380.1 hypothetical protein D0Y65_029598 [Glycine soja]|eukprot:XP_014619460.1 uncharacterized protein LOC100784908 isoform X2 [Glycine max]